jgi:ribosome-binding factor A
MIGHRAQRISEALREELNEMIGYEMSDPRVQDIEVIEVILSPDGKKAQVRLSVPGGETRQKDALDALEHARSFFKRELNIRLHMFRIPEMRFDAEGLPENGSRLDFLFRRIKRGRPRDSQPQGQPEPAMKKDSGQ